MRLAPVALYHRLRRAPVLGSSLLWLLERVLRGRATVTAPVLAGPLAGLRLELDPRVQADALLGRYEKILLEASLEALSPGDLAFDVGAHLGHVGLVLAQAVSPGGRVIMFEPDDGGRAGLERNLTRAASIHSARVEVVGAAVGARAGSAPFAPGSHTTRGRLDSSGAETVEVTTLDAATRRYGVPRLVKLDVEGGEVEALEGASNLLSRTTTTFAIEAHGDDRAAACRDLLCRAGYAVTRQREPGRAESYLVARPPS